MEKSILAICYEFSPQTWPTAIRSSKILKNIQKQNNWNIQVVTPVNNAKSEDSLFVHHVKPFPLQFLPKILNKLRLQKLIRWFIWPDEAIFWIIPAVLRARKLIKQQKIDTIVVFMMPYGAGLIGIILKWLTKTPLVLNFDDSYSCTDMNSGFESWIHYKMAIWLENFYVKQADAVIYVSQRNLEVVKTRQHQKEHSKFHLVRYGADIEDFQIANTEKAALSSSFEIIYIGGMSGWFSFYPQPKNSQLLKKILAAWNKLGNYKLVELDLRSHTPVIIGQAVKQVITEYPEWQGKIKVKIYGSGYPKLITDTVLENQDIADVVEIYPSVPHSQAIQMLGQSDLLFLTIPRRVDGTPGGRISAKTYEYLMTNKPILAAIPKGENWDYLENKPGVSLVEPMDLSVMVQVVSGLASKKFSGEFVSIDRNQLHSELSYASRAKEFSQVLHKIKS